MSLSDLLQPRICELGKIKIGAKEDKVRKTATGKEWRAPVKLDHFLITTMQRTAGGDLVLDSDLMNRLKEKHGDKDGNLRQIPVMLLSNDIEDVMQSAFVFYNGKTVAARSDGKKVTWFYDGTKRLEKPTEEEWTKEMADSKNDRGVPFFKLHSVFNCVIASNDSRWGGVYKFRTTSRITADQLYGSLLHLQSLTGGILVGLPLMLVVRPIQVAPEGKPTTVYVVHAELRGPDMQAIQSQALKIAEFQLQNTKRIQHAQIEYRKLLVAPGHETGDEAEAIIEEFTPEQLAAQEAPPTDPLLDGKVTTPDVPHEDAPVEQVDIPEGVTDSDIDSLYGSTEKPE